MHLCEIVLREEKYAFFDAHSKDRLDHVARARGTTNLGKFRTSCKEMLATNSQGAALQKACQQMRAAESAKSKWNFLRALDVASILLDTPLQISLTFDSSRSILFSCEFLRETSFQLMI